MGEHGARDVRHARPGGVKQLRTGPSNRPARTPLLHHCSRQLLRLRRRLHLAVLKLGRRLQRRLRAPGR